ncbi:hypothetical protein BB561_003375 [Smittium simulii]|uniref:Copper-fist domain-containing protein n=1 Tax=Smittium simulii TaxID=133385 RepID=A0A2T9YLR8_9FUNG|nr:hypothetical protein BB561_003375 [Smittium simulii]
MIIQGSKYSCEPCIRGHRANTCNHFNRKLSKIRPKGRPVSQCTHCRDLRKNLKIHIRCACSSKTSKITNLLNPCNCDSTGNCTCAHLLSMPFENPTLSSIELKHYKEPQSKLKLEQTHFFDVSVETPRKTSTNNYNFILKNYPDTLPQSISLPAHAKNDQSSENLSSELDPTFFYHKTNNRSNNSNLSSTVTADSQISDNSLLCFSEFIKKSTAPSTPNTDFSSTTPNMSFADNVVLPEPFIAPGCCSSNLKDSFSSKSISKDQKIKSLQPSLVSIDENNKDLEELTNNQYQSQSVSISVCQIKNSCCSSSGNTLQNAISAPLDSACNTISLKAENPLSCCTDCKCGPNSSCCILKKKHNVLPDSDGALSCGCGCRKPYVECSDCIKDMCEEVIFRPAL